jgi:ferredoxin
LETKVIACSCNQSVVKVERVPGAWPAKQVLAHQSDSLCRKDLSSFLEISRQATEQGNPVVVTCTRESPLFSKSAPEYAELRFVNIREHAGWGKEGNSAKAKIAALIASAAAAIVPELPSVSYRSSGKTLILADSHWLQARQWADHLASMNGIEATLLWTGSAGSSVASPNASVLSEARNYACLSGERLSLEGWLGNFKATWHQVNPIDWDACVGCGACINACPEGAIDSMLQVNLAACKGHRSCVVACDTAGAIDFSRLNTLKSSNFDVVLDFRASKSFQRDAPQGYFWTGPDYSQQIAQVFEVIQAIGEFDKPKYFDYKAKSCAHGRNQQIACTKCIDVCSTGAISSAGDQIKVEPHLCMGCGACSTVCPTGAIRFQAPDTEELGRRMRTILTTYLAAKGVLPVILFYDRRHGALPFETAQLQLPKNFRGLPARVIPVEVEHVGSIGLEVLLAAKAYGAAQVLLLTGSTIDDGYKMAIGEQVAFGNQILQGLGFDDAGLKLLSTSGSDFFDLIWSLKPSAVIKVPGSFALPKDKREALNFAIDYLIEQQHGNANGEEASAAPIIALKEGAPFGGMKVDSNKCTLCMACTGVCPKSALLDGQDKPQLRFIEANCVQCGLCVQTCPESAITLIPQLDRSESAKNPKVVSETTPMNCTSCGKAFGTKQMVDAMLSKLSAHSMFAGDGIKRLSMCADCRVVDMIKNPVDASIHDYMPSSSGAVTALTRNKGPNQ